MQAIERAYKARVDMLRAIFGGDDKTAANEPEIKPASKLLSALRNHFGKR
jgi:hypothetical protein